MSKNLQNIILATSLLVLVIFITSIHTVITPFLAAGALAFIFFPLVILTENKTGWSRIVSAIIVYLVITSTVFILAVFTTLRLRVELNEVTREYLLLEKQLIIGAKTAPAWIRPLLLDNIQLLNISSLVNSRRLWPYFTGAISGVGSIFVFLVSLFYFLKEGDKFVKICLRFVSEDSRKIDVTANKIRQILDGYLRGQFFLVVLMGTVSFLVLALLKVKYALLLGIFTGFAEIVPFIGPIAAATLASIVAVLDGVPILSLPQSGEVLVISGIYFILRQLEDYFIIPIVMGKVTRLHPLFILFLVLAGGHIWGIFGMIISVPLAAVIRLLFEANNQKSD
jgi:predicted PurR-regulated permease PerM